MNDIYEYKDLKGILRVGDEVSAVPGKANPCSKLKDDGSNTAKITDISRYISNEMFFIDGCAHNFNSGNFLRIVKRVPITWDTIRRGDIAVNISGEKAMILSVSVEGKDFLRSNWEDYSRAAEWYSLEEAKGSGWTLEQPEVEVKPREVTMQEVVEKFGENVVIKKEN